MNNIFDFATKELSQDAFLSWFIANCNDENIGEYSYKFINFLTGFNFKVGEIKKINIKQQERNIDIIVDLWTFDNLHYVFIIEDKTTSSAHDDQLKNYANEMNKWNNDEVDYIRRRRKIFYKVNFLTEQDELEIQKGNDNFDINDQWRVFDIDKIYSFFASISVTKSEILNSYVEHIKQIYNDLHFVSEKPIKEWNFINFETFFSKIIRTEFFNEKWKFNFKTWPYRGRALSVCFYYTPNNEKFYINTKGKHPCFAYPLIEFVFRKYTKKIMIYTHVLYCWYNEQEDKNGIDNSTWKYNNYEPNVSKAKSFMETLKSTLNEQLGVKTHKMNSAHDQTISVDYIEILDSKDEMIKIILNKLCSYFEAFEIADKRY